MSSKVLEEILRILIAEERDARVPNQLMSDDFEDEDEEVNEFSGVGAVAGPILPLGMSPETPSKKK